MTGQAGTTGEGGSTSVDDGERGREHCAAKVSALRLLGCGFNTKDSKNATHCLPAWLSVSGVGMAQ